MSAESGAAVGVPTPPGVPVPPGAPAVPPPPAGPGVQPPFVAPPTDGTRQRRWVAIGLATGFAVLVCVGGLVALGGLVVLGTQVVRDEAEASVTKYLTALRDEKYTQAYALLCDREQARVSEANFVNTQLDAPHVTSFSVGGAELSDQIRVPATVNYANGAMDSIHYIMEQDAETGAVEVCGQED
jgi:hypothetical protein